MTILETDIKLLKAAVMADTSDGGGAMTGTQVVDGVSNNIFPDTSEIDRALGRVSMRKVFGVAQTASTDTLLGAHAIITDAPDDPLVGCLLMEATAWGDTRAEARTKVEQYMVKGPRLSCRLFDTHYAGSLQVRLYNANSTTDFPAAGDAIVLRNPGGNEQYVRIRKVVRSTQSFTILEGSNYVSVDVTIALCDISNELAYDFLGAPIARAIVNETSTYASVYTTSLSSGAKFYGIKPIGVDGAIGDVSITTTGGIYAPLVPAATSESPITDQHPYTGRGALSRTALNTITLPTIVGMLQGGSVLTTPTAIEPGSISLVHFGVSFTDDGQGTLLQGATAVGTVVYKTGVITLNSSAPIYFSGAGTLSYKPATSVSTAAFSSELAITSANQGLAFTNSFQPIPAPGSFSLSYMAQGRWYELVDNANGKLAGSDSSYGIGSISYSTGSMSVTLGAIPDIGSALVATWGASDGAAKFSETLPSKLYAYVSLHESLAISGLTINWNSGGVAKSATSAANGTLTGDATGMISGGSVRFEPNSFPDGTVSFSYGRAPSRSTGYVDSGGGHYTLDHTGVVPGTFTAQLVLATYATNILPVDSFITAYDRDGVLFARFSQVGAVASNVGYSSREAAIGTINYSTGEVVLNASATVYLTVQTLVTPPSSGFASSSYYAYSSQNVSLPFANLANLAFSYGSPATFTATESITQWRVDTPLKGKQGIITGDIALTVGSTLYTCQNGIMRKGWDFRAGTPTVANAGSASSNGQIVITSAPLAGETNSVTWGNAALNLATSNANHGVYRTSSAPLKTGVFQMMRGAAVTTGNDAGALSGGNMSGTIDYDRGIVRWTNVGLIDQTEISYNAVFLQFLPLDADLLGIETARLPLDGKVPIFRQGGIVVLHNTQNYSLPNPLTKGTTYSVGRVRVAAMKVKTATGATVSSTLYTTDLDAGTLVFPVASDLTGLVQPFTVEHRIEDVMLCSTADISGKLSFTRALTHDFPAGSSYASSALVIGDVFARAYNGIEQNTWTGVWSNSLIGSAPATANYNEVSNPITVTNQGAITERWALIFTNSTTFNIVGEKVGVIGTGTTGVNCSPVNPATGVPYFTINAAGWGTGWSIGNVYRFNTEACGAPIWIVRTVLQGPATLQDDKFTLAFRGDVDRP